MKDCSICCIISIHAPARGATLPLPVPERFLLNFNPRSREGSDDQGCQFTSNEYIFQSTLPRGERLLVCVSNCFLLCISIHAPARGATFAIPTRPFSSFYFNPRSREGSDIGPFKVIRFNGISIHAPARGATEEALRSLELKNDFNPRSREGSDRLFSSSGIRNSDFNPRSREGSDHTVPQ